ncbi:hypothetical protein MXB_5461 [Myxobolus squamalis]|nr:hypothetical protein MXB_5461 [Myxobolus squamalis]
MEELTNKLVRNGQLKKNPYHDVLILRQTTKLFQELEHIFRYCLHEDHSFIFILQQCYELYMCRFHIYDCNVLKILDSFLSKKKLRFEILQQYELLLSNRIISGKLCLLLEEEVFKIITVFSSLYNQSNCDTSYTKNIHFNIILLNNRFLNHLKQNIDEFFIPIQFEQMMNSIEDQLKRDLPKKQFSYIPLLV